MNATSSSCVALPPSGRPANARPKSRARAVACIIARLFGAFAARSSGAVVVTSQYPPSGTAGISQREPSADSAPEKDCTAPPAATTWASTDSNSDMSRLTAISPRSVTYRSVRLRTTPSNGASSFPHPGTAARMVVTSTEER
ncbi:hypothetical protein WME90_04265 [Sorangium sp. So ce375]|uniref:hypothetical protein n=1 Tax=Sorangium sp. So ce375 TaxID=3133306 RepID=UPI003F5AFD0D